MMVLLTMLKSLNSKIAMIWPLGREETELGTIRKFLSSKEDMKNLEEPFWQKDGLKMSK